MFGDCFTNSVLCIVHVRVYFRVSLFNMPQMSHDDLVRYIGSMERQVADTEVHTLLYNISTFRCSITLLTLYSNVTINIIITVI